MSFVAEKMVVSPFCPARIPQPITDARLAQAYAAEEILTAMLDDLYQDMRAGAAIQASGYAIIERLRPPPAVARMPQHVAARVLFLVVPRIRDPEPITDQRLEQAFAAESLLDAMLDDLYRDLAGGAAVVSREYQLVWRHRPTRAVSLALHCING